MGLVVRRLFFGALWFVVFWFVFGAVGGGVAGAVASAKKAQAGAPAQGFNQGYQTGYAAGLEFHQRYGSTVKYAAILCAAVGSVAGILPGTKKDS